MALLIEIHTKLTDPKIVIVEGIKNTNFCQSFPQSAET